MGVGGCRRYVEASVFTGVVSAVNGASRWETCEPSLRAAAVV